MKVYEIDPSNFGKYQHLLSNILRKPNMCGVFSEGCGHCQNMKPEWEKLKSRVANTAGNGSLVEFDSRVMPMVNYPELTSRISGYPTILLFKNGKVCGEYTGNRSSDDMYRSFTNNLSQKKDEDTTTDEEQEQEQEQEQASNRSRSKSSRKKTSSIRKKRQKKKRRTQKGGSKRRSKRKRVSKAKGVKRCCCNMGRCSRMCICGDRCLPHCPCCGSK